MPDTPRYRWDDRPTTITSTWDHGPTVTQRPVNVDVDTDTDRFAVWKDGTGWVPFDINELLAAHVAELEPHDD